MNVVLIGLYRIVAVTGILFYILFGIGLVEIFFNSEQNIILELNNPYHMVRIIFRRHILSGVFNKLLRYR